MNKENIRRCYHEAGHAVVALALGAEVTEMTSTGVNIAYDGDTTTPSDRAAMKVAGVIAERIKYGRANWLMLGGLDYPQAERIMQDAGLGCDLRPIERQARTILKERWSLVEKFAEQLMSEPASAGSN